MAGPLHRKSAAAPLTALLAWTASLSRPEAAMAAAPSTSSLPAASLGFAHRNLEDNNYNRNRNYETDISNYSVRFGKCQYVKTFDDDVAEDEESDTVFAVKHFVVYRLCPSDSCETCDETYGEYVMGLEEYLEATTEYARNAFEEGCNQCQEECNDDGSGCTGCGLECWKYENLEDNGYVLAADYVQCQKLDANQNDADEEGEGEGEEGDNRRRRRLDDEELELYIGPRCSSDGSRIYIGLFTDEECFEPYTDVSVEDALGKKVSHKLIQHIYSSDGTDCISCRESAENNGGNDAQDEDDVNEMCEELYDQSAKCESKHGIQGFVMDNKEQQDYENQVETEFMACTFIDSLVWGSYTETGEINIEDEQDVILRETTTVQKVALSSLLIVSAGLGFVIFYLHRHINTGFPNLDLACHDQSGAVMA